MIKKYEEFVSGHLIAQTAPICPATLEVDMAVEALLSLRPDFTASNLQPQNRNVDNQAPICMDSSRAVWLDLEAVDADFHTWNWKLVSTGVKGSATTLHVSGKILFRSVDDPQFQAEFARYERLVGHQRCLSVLNSPDADDIIQGRNIYKTFAEIVDYGETYRGLQKLVGKGNESAGRVVKQYNGETWLDTHLSDCFSQVGGIWVNCMTDRAPTDMFIANGFEHWIRSPKLGNQDTRLSVWDVFAYHSHPSDKTYLTNIFIFNSTNGALMEVILGINYAKVPKLSMSKILSRLIAGGVQSFAPAATPSPSAKLSKPAKVTKPKKEKKTSSGPDIPGSVRAVLADLSGLESADIKADTQLADIGIDSLMGMELAHELEGRFKCSLPEEQLVEVTTFQTLVQCVQSVSGPMDDGATSESDDDDDEPSSGSQSADTLSESITSVSSTAKMALAEYLTDFLGIGESDVVPETLLRDLGVDSLLSTEIRSDIAGKFDIHISDDIMIEELTVKELDMKINGQSGGASKTTSATPAETAKAETPEVNGTTPAIGSGVTGFSAGGNLNVPASTILEAFGGSKMLTDQFIADYRCADYLEVVNPKQTQLCVALTLDPFEQLRCPLRTAKAGQKLGRIKYLPQHGRLAEYLYNILEKEARLIDVDVKNKLPPQSQGNGKLSFTNYFVVLSDSLAEVVLAHLYSTELTINEIALSQVLIITNHSNFQQLKCLYACVESIKSWFGVFFTIPPTAYIGFPFSIFSQIVRCLVTLYRLSTLNDPAWDKNGVWKTADLLLILDQVINNMEQVKTLAGLDNNDCPEGDIFSRTAKLFRSIRPEWEAKLGPDDLMVSTIPTPQNANETPLPEVLPVDFSDNEWLDLFLSPNY